MEGPSTSRPSDHCIRWRVVGFCLNHLVQSPRELLRDTAFARSGESIDRGGVCYWTISSIRCCYKHDGKKIRQ